MWSRMVRLWLRVSKPGPEMRYSTQAALSMGPPSDAASSGPVISPPMMSVTPPSPSSRLSDASIARRVWASSGSTRPPRSKAEPISISPSDDTNTGRKALTVDMRSPCTAKTCSMKPWVS